MFKWTCPFCNHNAIIEELNYHKGSILFLETLGEKKGAVLEIIECPNPDCENYTFSVSLNEVYWTGELQAQVWHVDRNRIIKKWNLIPPSEAKKFPDYIPRPILEDYEEACLIKDLSPKASATLSRRCLQGMIRDFWEVRKDNLKSEIEAIKDKVDPPTWEAIDSTRKIGNIGAHMEKDVNLIISVDPKEAELLIKLIEILIADWYIKKHEKKKQLEEIKKISEQKESQKRK